MTVDRFLSDSAQRLPDKIAVVAGATRLSYSALVTQAGRVAAWLRAAGVQRGDRVIICVSASEQAIPVIFGTLLLGAVFVVLHPTIKAQKLAYIFDDAQAAALVLDARQAGVRPRIPPSGLRAVLIDGDAVALSPQPGRTDGELAAVLSDSGLDAAIDSPAIDLDLAALIYTSGSTGQPKGVMLSHGNIVSAATSINGYLENTEDDIILNLLPLSFDYGLYQVLLAFQAGARIVLERGMAYPHATLQRLVEERVTALPIVPTLAALLLQVNLQAYDLSSLRYVTNTAAALPTSHITALQAQLPHVRIFSMYGLTECKRVAYLPPEQLAIRPASVGHAMPNVEVFVADDEGRCHASGVGELVVRGSNVMQGYWGLPDETDRVLRPGPLPGERLLYTGDLFRIDAEGFLYFVARKDDIIKTRGEKVAPREVENVLAQLPGVAEAAVIGVPDPILGEAVKAVVTLTPGSTLDEAAILHHCAQALEDFMVPRTVEIRETLPRTPSGKIARRELGR